MFSLHLSLPSEEIDFGNTRGQILAWFFTFDSM